MKKNFSYFSLWQNFEGKRYLKNQPVCVLPIEKIPKSEKPDFIRAAGEYSEFLCVLPRFKRTLKKFDLFFCFRKIYFKGCSLFERVSH